MDISKCLGFTCKVKNSCKRFTSKSSERQSYIEGNANEFSDCEFFINNQE